MHETFDGLHDSPFKLTFTRCLRAVTCLMPTASDIAPLYVKDKSVGLKMVAKVCAFQELSGDIKTEAMTTSTSEHLIHQLLLSGMDGTLHLNKNGLRGSALYKVSFKFDDGADHVETYQVIKMTPKMCKQFKEKSSKITADSQEETEMISEEFFEKVMGNSFNPDLVGKQALQSDQKWKFNMTVLTIRDMTEALNSLDEGYHSIPEKYESYKSFMDE